MRSGGDAISPNWITTDRGLEAAVAGWGPVIGLDTEFQRTNTFYPRPGLYQVVDRAEVFLIDPLSIDQWAPFVEVLEDPDVTLIVHACGEDLELMSHHLGAVPTGLFDTQLGHAFISQDYALSYANLVMTHLGVTLGKPQTRSDWRRRPLSEAQVRYACEDVTHLPELHRRLSEELERLDRRHWFEETMAEQRYAPVEPDAYYLSMRKAWRLSGDDLAVLKSLTNWRERTAMAENVPRNRVVWDEHLVTLARYRDLDSSEVWSLLPKPVARRYAEELVKAHRLGREAAPVPRLEPPLTQSQGEVSKKLRDVARAEADSMQISHELLARKRDVERCIRHYAATGDLSSDYTGWRESLVGDSFRSILSRLR
jgi:ribonuclease D